MNAARFLPTPLLTQFNAVVSRIDALPGRERLALFGAAFALIAALELLLVQPAATRRALIENASVEQAQRQADEHSQAEQARMDKQTELQTQLARIDAELAQLGAGASGSQSLGFLLTQALARQDVRIVSLRELAVENIRGEADTPADATAPAEAATLYRHRFEVALGGQPGALIEALRTLDRSARPLRIERVRMSARDAASVQLTITLAVIGTERAWLSI